jgi:hypothetical protein
MPQTTLVREIHNYALNVHSHPVYAHIIILYSSTDGIIGRLYFTREPSAPHISHSGQITNLTLPQTQYLPSVDILRNESPVFLHSSTAIAKLTTLQEPVGESEEIPPDLP